MRWVYHCHPDVQVRRLRHRAVRQLANGPRARQQHGQYLKPCGLAPHLSATLPYRSLTCSPDWTVVRLTEAQENTWLWELERLQICKTLLFLMTNEVGRGMSISSGEKTILKGGSMVTIECS